MHLNNEKLHEFIGGITKLPSLPSLYLQLLEEVQSADCALKRVVQIISKDMGMTAKILQLANSAYYGIRKEINGVDKAVLFLGLDLIKNFTLVAHVFSQFDRMGMGGQSIAGLWRHSMACSGLARQIARGEAGQRQIIDESATAGLLHDIGKLLMATHLGEGYERLHTLACENSEPLHLIEQEELGFTHAAVGGYLLHLWDLPQQVIEAVAYHHCPEKTGSQNFSALTAVHLANYLDHTAEMEFNSPPCSYQSEYLEGVSLCDPVERWEQIYSGPASEQNARAH